MAVPETGLSGINIGVKTWKPTFNNSESFIENKSY